MAERQYLRQFEFVTDRNNAVIYEDVDGITHEAVSAGNRRRVSKTVWQSTKTPPLNIGDAFIADGISAICTRISISDEVVSVEGQTPMRIWRVSIDGIEGADGSSSRYSSEKSISRKLNGTVETALNGETVILKRSDTPITTVHVVAYTETDTPPVLVGASLEGGIVTGVDTTKTVVESDGMKIAEIYRHEMDVAL